MRYRTKLPCGRSAREVSDRDRGTSDPARRIDSLAASDAGPVVIGKHRETNSPEKRGANDVALYY